MTKKNVNNLDIPVEDIQPNRMHRLQQRVIIGSIRATRFSNSRADSSKKDEIHTDTGAEMSMFSFSKKLLTKSVLTRVQQHYSRARDLMRVPKANGDGSVKYDPMRFGIAQWNSGQTLIPVGRMQDLIVAFQMHKSALENELRELEPIWNQQLREAEEAAGELFDADLMPAFDDFAKSWSMELDLEALPEFDPRITLDDMQLNDVVTQVRNNTANKLTTTLSASWKAAAESMLTSLKYTAAVLGNNRPEVQALNGTKDKRKSDRAVPIADTLFDNLRNQIATVRSLAEAADDAGLLKLADDAAMALGRSSVDELRKNPEQRKRLAGVARSLVHRAKEQVADSTTTCDTAVDDLAAFG